MEIEQTLLADRVRELATARLHVGVNQQESDLLLLVDVQRKLLEDIENGLVLTDGDTASVSELVDGILELFASAFSIAAEANGIDPILFWEVVATKMSTHDDL
jgi:hypothetical protein